MSQTIYVYKIYCETEAQWKYWYLDTETPPTTCPTNTADTVTLSSVDLEREITDNIVAIKELDVPTGSDSPFGYLYVETAYIDADAGVDVVTEKDFSWPFPVAHLNLQVMVKTENEGDFFTLIIAPNTTIGAITANVAIDDTILNVSSTVIQYAVRGYHINLFDGVNTDDLGRIVSIDSVNSQITMSQPATMAFSAASPTYVRMERHGINDLEMGPANTYILGATKLGSSYMPAGMIARVRYKNKTTSAKRLGIIMEYMY